MVKCGVCGWKRRILGAGVPDWARAACSLHIQKAYNRHYPKDWERTKAELRALLPKPWWRFW